MKELKLIRWVNDGYPPINLNDQVSHVTELVAEIKRLREVNDEYNGLSPDTVKEMYEALKEIDSRTDVYSPIDMTWLSNFINPIITKAEQELKK